MRHRYEGKFQRTHRGRRVRLKVGGWRRCCAKAGEERIVCPTLAVARLFHACLSCYERWLPRPRRPKAATLRIQIPPVMPLHGRRRGENLPAVGGENPGDLLNLFTLAAERYRRCRCPERRLVASTFLQISRAGRRRDVWYSGRRFPGFAFVEPRRPLRCWHVPFADYTFNAGPVF